MLDDEERAAAVDELAEGGEELGDVFEVEAGGGLVEDVEDAAAVGRRRLGSGIAAFPSRLPWLRRYAGAGLARCWASLTRWASPPESVVADWPRRT